MESSLELYQEIKQQHDTRCIYKLVCYWSIDCFVGNPTEDEYKVISNKCIEIFLELDECDLIKLADLVSFKYSVGELTLEDLVSLTDDEILKLIGWWN